MRAFCGISTDWIAEQPIRRLTDAVSGIGLLAFSRDVGKDTADAGTILLRRGGVSLINSHMKVGRRRLALAHELGHYLVADDYTVDGRYHRVMSELTSPFETIAARVGMRYRPGHFLHGVGDLTDERLADAARDYARWSAGREDGALRKV